MICPILELKRHCHLPCFGQPCDRLPVFSKLELGLCLPRASSQGSLRLAASPSALQGALDECPRPESSSGIPGVGPWGAGGSLSSAALAGGSGHGAQRGQGSPSPLTSLSAWHGVGHFCFKAKGWREVGKGDSVTLIPRLVAELVCCEAEGDRRGHAGRGGSRWHLPATRS